MIVALADLGALLTLDLCGLEQLLVALRFEGCSAVSLRLSTIAFFLGIVRSFRVWTLGVASDQERVARQTRRTAVGALLPAQATGPAAWLASMRTPRLDVGSYKGHGASLQSG